MKAVLVNTGILLSSIIVILLGYREAYTANFIHMERPRLGMELTFEYEEEKREGPFINRVDNTTDLTEKLEIATEGWVYHPALATYSLTFIPEWEQSRTENNTGNSSFINRDSNFLQGYDAQLIILPRKPYTLTLFANSTRDKLRNNFAGRTTTEDTLYGAQLAFKEGFMPTTIGYDHRERSSSGYYEENTKENRLRLSSSNRSKFGFIRLSGLYSKSETASGARFDDVEEQSYSVTHDRPFSENKVLLTSALRYDETFTNTTTDRGYSIYENLSWRHRENLRTRYNFNYRDREAFYASTEGMTDLNIVSGNFNLNHRLYENLTTNVSTGVTRNRNTGNEDLIYDAGVDFNYVRKVPVGAIQVTMGQRATVTEVDYSSDTTRVLDEPVSLVYTFTFLENEDIDITSIVVKDGAGTIYRQAGNYELSTIGTLTRIRCISGGQLDRDLDCSAGAPVLVDYTYRIRFPFDYWIHDQSYGVYLNLEKALDIYYRFRKSKQYFLRGIRSTTDILFNDQSHSLGAALKMNWSETTLDFENRQSTTLPMKSVRLREVITVAPSYYSLMRISLGYTRTDYKTEDDTEKLTDFSVSYESVIARRAKISANGFYTRMSSPSQRTDFQGFLVSLDWVYRIYRGTISYSYAQEKDKIIQKKEINNYVLFTVKRELY